MKAICVLISERAMNELRERALKTRRAVRNEAGYIIETALGLTPDAETATADNAEEEVAHD